MMYHDTYDCICRNTKYKKWSYTIQYVKPTAHLVLKNRFPKRGPTCWRQVVNPRHQTSQWQSVAKPEYPSWVARCDMKGSDGTMLIPILRNNVQGQKHHGRWGNVEHQIPSIKVLFWTNAKSHTHSDVILLSLDSKTQLINQRKQNSYRRAYIYTHIFINTELDGNKGHQEETHHPTHRFRRLFLDLLSMGWRGCASAMGAIKLPLMIELFFFKFDLQNQRSKS